MKDKRAQLSHEQFFTLTEELRNAREQIETTCSTRAQLRTLLIERGKLPFAPSLYSLDTAIKLVGIKLAPPPTPKQRFDGGEATRIRGRDKAIIVSAIVELYRQLGVEPPKNLSGLMRDLSEWGAEKQAPPVPAVPVASVPPAHKLAIAN
jgi:hypothetical protein